ncbi:MAG: chemotaxis protein [Xanthobacteraceae bacterium]|nr:chemotaxis protein [Xanthobacteraceae bacterium]QYK44059.1 MAG: chemotaxis protein [Xanthobacteraceae bacterium]
MSGNLYGLIIEGLVAILLGLTIGYCIVLNKRLARLRSDESAMRGTIGELITATEFAERAINNLRTIARETNDTLGESLRTARETTQSLDEQMARGNEVLQRIAQIADVAEAARMQPAAPQQEPVNVAPMRSAAKTAQAAQALAMRARLRAGEAA